MPKLLVQLSIWQASADPAVSVVEVSLDGFIDAANYAIFEKSLETSSRGGERYEILDFTNVHYINSTGISALIRQFELYRSRGGTLCLAAVQKPVGLSMHLLGVTSFLPFLPDVTAAREYMRAQVAGTAGGAVTVDPDLVSAAGKGQEALAPRPIRLGRRRQQAAGKSKVVVITPSKTRFTRVMRLRFNDMNGDYHLLHDVREALEKYDELAPDLIVVDERCDPKGEFVNRVKIQKERSLTSIIKLYPKTRSVQEELEFKIWENDYLVEPFEVLELFSLTEAELCRVPKDKKVFQQQVHFEWRTTPENVEKAYKLSDLILRQSVASPEDATALYAAVKEGIDNAVVHGNRSDPGKTIDANFLVDHKKVTVIIEDQGEGFDYEYYLTRIHDEEAFEKAKRRILDEGVRGGLGILLMSKCSDRIEYSGGGNVLRLEKNL